MSVCTDVLFACHREIHVKGIKSTVKCLLTDIGLVLLFSEGVRNVIDFLGVKLKKVMFFS